MGRKGHEPINEEVTMRIFDGFDNLPRIASPVVTVGSYDGVHSGHRELLGLINSTAAARGGESVVVTFRPHPRVVLGKAEGLRLLSSQREKEALLEQAGVDNLVVVPFTPEFSRVEAEAFVRDYLVGRLRVDTLVVGYNHHFGHNKSGDFGFLDRLRAELGFDVLEVPRHRCDDHKVSSTEIRRLIEAGDMGGAARLLGRNYTALMYPGADGSLATDDALKLMPPEGTYAVTVDEGTMLSPNMLSVGPKGRYELFFPLFATPERVTVSFCR